jgi:hypothetical protein
LSQTPDETKFRSYQAGDQSSSELVTADPLRGRARKQGVRGGKKKGRGLKERGERAYCRAVHNLVPDMVHFLL